MKMEMMTMSLARRVERLQARKAGAAAADPKKLLRDLQTLPKALGSLDKVSQHLDDTQKAIVQILREMDYQDFENRRQRAVQLRMQIDIGLSKVPVAGLSADEYVTAMMIYEDQLRAEYDAVVGLVNLFDLFSRTKES